MMKVIIKDKDGRKEYNAITFAIGMKRSSMVLPNNMVLVMDIHSIEEVTIKVNDGSNDNDNGNDNGNGLTDEPNSIMDVKSLGNGNGNDNDNNCYGNNNSNYNNNSNTNHTKDRCPNCNNALIMQEGCSICMNCYYSACSLG